MRTKAIFVSMLLALAPLPSVAQDIDAGWKSYESGDYAAALEEWKPLAEQGYARAQSNLGVMYENGWGVLQDYAESVRLYRLAAEQGDADAQSNLGVMYFKGHGVVQDDAEALRLYRLAAAQGNANAQNNLGFMYDYGNGVAQSYVKAHMWYNIAAANGADKAAEYRKSVANLISTADISEAQRLARVCMESNYRDCN